MITGSFGRTGALASLIGGSELAPTIGLIDLEPGDGLLLCTDNITAVVARANRPI